MMRDRADRVALAGALLLPTALAIVLLPVRPTFDNANIATLLVVAVVAVAALGRRWAAALSALTAAAAFDFFHTLPYLTFRITTRHDLQTDLSLLVVGLAVGELAARGRRQRRLAVARSAERDQLEGLGALVAVGEEPDFILMTVASALTDLLELEDCRFEVGGRDDVFPTLESDGAVIWGPTAWDARRWGLPSKGVDVPVCGHGKLIGRFVCRPREPRSISAEQRRRAVALANQAGAALAGGRSLAA